MWICIYLDHILLTKRTSQVTCIAFAHLFWRDLVVPVAFLKRGIPRVVWGITKTPMWIYHQLAVDFVRPHLGEYVQECLNQPEDSMRSVGCAKSWCILGAKSCGCGSGVPRSFELSVLLVKSLRFSKYVCQVDLISLPTWAITSNFQQDSTLPLFLP